MILKKEPAKKITYPDMPDGFNSEKLRLSIGSGSVRLSNCINLELEPNEQTDADVYGDVSKGLEFDDEIFTEVLMFHVIEHIRRMYHVKVFDEVWRVLKPGGRYILAFPDIITTMKAFIANDCGARWKTLEMGIYGAHRRPGDAHVAAIERSDITSRLMSAGFVDIKYKQLGVNAIMTVRKGEKLNDYL
jgi:ubiquinone/menaquinone biosynthesis C-methylase UbiE